MEYSDTFIHAFLFSSSFTFSSLFNIETAKCLKENIDDITIHSHYLYDNWSICEISYVSHVPRISARSKRSHFTVAVFCYLKIEIKVQTTASMTITLKTYYAAF